MRFNRTWLFWAACVLFCVTCWVLVIWGVVASANR